MSAINVGDNLIHLRVRDGLFSESTHTVRRISRAGRLITATKADDYRNPIAAVHCQGLKPARLRQFNPLPGGKQRSFSLITTAEHWEKDRTFFIRRYQRLVRKGLGVS